MHRPGNEATIKQCEAVIVQTCSWVPGAGPYAIHVWTRDKFVFHLACNSCTKPCVVYPLKVGDLGMSRDLADAEYYVFHGGKIPVRWTSPEAMYYRRYSTASDVWSYGCLLYEIWSLGRMPFKNYTNAEVQFYSCNINVDLKRFIPLTPGY